MGCNSCGDPMFQPKPLTPQEAADFTAALETPGVKAVTHPTLVSGVMQYPPNARLPAAIDGFEKTAETMFESVMPPCDRRYEVMAMGRDGVTTVKHTCLHELSGHTNQYVSLAICQDCPLRKL